MRYLNLQFPIVLVGVVLMTTAGAVAGWVPLAPPNNNSNARVTGTKKTKTSLLLQTTKRCGGLGRSPSTAPMSLLPLLSSASSDDDDDGRGSSSSAKNTAETSNGKHKNNNDDEDEDSIDIGRYWELYRDLWEPTLRNLDVKAAYLTGSLDGILPSGRPSRGTPNERLISLARAVELFEEDESTFLVRRRFRRMKIDELAPRWDKAMKTRDDLRARDAWNTAIADSEKFREFEKAVVEGSVESADASPGWSRAVVTALSPALKLAANQRNKADAGVAQARVDLLELSGSADATPVDRWITGALLADMEEEVEKLTSADSTMAMETAFGGSLKSTSSSLFADTEAQRDVEDAGGGALLGVLLAVVTFALISVIQ